MKAMTVAQYIINKCTEACTPISNLKLQKILYYIQVACLQKLKEPCFIDPIEAWQFGPVVREVYYQYSPFGAFPISWEYPDVFIPSDKKKAVIDRIIFEKIDMQPWALVTDTHSPGKAWSRTYNANKNRSIISLEDMYYYG